MSGFSETRFQHGDEDGDDGQNQERNRLSVWFDEKGFLNHGLT
jgi:hypothetical protein